MSNLPYKIRLYLNREIDFRKDVIVLDEGQGQYIKEWNVVEAQPTDEQLNAFESQAETLENNNQVINTRINLYGTTAEQLEYIVENGVEAFIEKQQQIKISNPKE